MLLNLLAGVALAGFGPPKMVDRETSATIRLTPGELQLWYHAAVPPDVSAKALLVYDVDADRILYSRSADTPLPPASLTKLMTALLVLESDRLEEVVSVDASDLVGGATMGLVAGEELTVKELLWGLLVASGNDAATALARHLGGDVDRFVAAMNARAEALGLGATRFVNPNGFDALGHESSATDVLALTLRLLEYPLFREIVGAGEAEIAGHALTNTNEMLGLYPGVEGVKTGTTANAGQCLVLSVSEDEHRVIVIIMGSNDRYTDSVRLLDLYNANYEWARGDSGDLSVLNRLYDADGTAVSLRADGEPISLLRHRWGDPGLVEFRAIADSAHSTPTSEQRVGTVEWWAGDDLQAQSELLVR